MAPVPGIIILRKSIMTRLKITDKTSLDAALQVIKNLNLEGKAWTVEVKQHRKNRTLAQNRLYWMWLGEIGETLGYDIKDKYQKNLLHAGIALRLNFVDTGMVLGKETTVAKPTSNLDVKEFTEYLERVDHFAADELGITLRHPKDAYYEAMGREFENDEKATQGL
jgi:hypothetical protein